MTKIAYDFNKNVHSMSQEYQKMTYFDGIIVNHLFFCPKKMFKFIFNLSVKIHCIKSDDKVISLKKNFNKTI